MKETEYGGRTGFLLSEKVKEIPNLKNAKIIPAIKAITTKVNFGFKYATTKRLTAKTIQNPEAK